MTELAKVDKLETAKRKYTKIIEGEQQFASLLPDIGIDQIIGSALFQDKMILEVMGEVSAGYMINDITTGNIEVSRDGTITIILEEPKLFWVTLTWELQTSKSGIVAQSEIALEHQLREKAGELMIQEALSWGILQEAKNNAQSALQDVFLKAQIQIKEVIIKGMGDETMIKW